jgi:hypothetical protein
MRHRTLEQILSDTRERLALSHEMLQTTRRMIVRGAASRRQRSLRHLSPQDRQLIELRMTLDRGD